MPKVFNIRHKDAPAGAVFCGRGSPYGNPYVIGRDGDRDKVCNKFRDNILPTLDVKALKGKDLLCFCKPARCHCDDILIKANPMSAESLPPETILKNTAKHLKRALKAADGLDNFQRYGEGYTSLREEVHRAIRMLKQQK